MRENSCYPCVFLPGFSRQPHPYYSLWSCREQRDDLCLPHLCLTERALVGQDLLGRFADLIQSGKFQLHLDSKTFPADTTLYFLHGDSFVTSPRTQLGCLEGFYRVSVTSQDPLVCGRYPPPSGLRYGTPRGFRKGQWTLGKGVDHQCIGQEVSSTVQFSWESINSHHSQGSARGKVQCVTLSFLLVLPQLEPWCWGHWEKKANVYPVSWLKSSGFCFRRCHSSQPLYSHLPAPSVAHGDETGTGWLGCFCSSHECLWRSLSWECSCKVEERCVSDSCCSLYKSL